MRSLAPIALALAVAACGDPAVVARPPYLAASQTEIDFGDVLVGESKQQSFFLINKGDLTLSVNGTLGDLLGVFKVEMDETKAGQDRDMVVQVAFAPLEPIPYTTDIVFLNDSANEPEFTLVLKGNGLPGDPCRNKVCATPPGRTCITSTTSRTFNPAGRCVAGQCEYDPVDETCGQWGCDLSSGACRTDPCVGVSCIAPPQRSCIDPATSRGYNPAGHCAGGQCSYDPIDQACADWGCDPQTGACRGDPCVGLSCTTPPPRACLDSTTSRAFNPGGHCSGGSCQYDPVDESCAFGCDPQSNACKPDPCLGISCNRPPNECFQASGTCQLGACNYPLADGLECTDGDPCTTGDRCQSGSCRGTRKTCEAPPDPSCLNPTTMRRWEAVGTCGGAIGACSYQHWDTFCDFGCQAGACLGDPCAGGCDDGNPCTTDTCVRPQGCVHTANSGAACPSGSSECPRGHCSGTRCLPDPDVTCQATYDMDLCQEATIAGVCTGSGDCVVREAPPEYRCPGCNGICLRCYIIEICIPFG